LPEGVPKVSSTAWGDNKIDLHPICILSSFCIILLATH
jgi:hypothetical protein